jgi:hypothetical protein
MEVQKKNKRYTFEMEESRDINGHQRMYENTYQEDTQDT